MRFMLNLSCSGINSGNKEGDVVGTIEWELAGLTDEDGMLKAFLQGYSFTLIPPEVSLKKGKRGVKVSFPIPAKLGKNRPKITGLSWYLTWYKELINTGWQVKDDFKGITNDFCELLKERMIRFWSLQKNGVLYGYVLNMWIVLCLAFTNLGLSQI